MSAAITFFPVPQCHGQSPLCRCPVLGAGIPVPSRGRGHRRPRPVCDVQVARGGLWVWEVPGPVETRRPRPPPDAHLPASPAPSFRGSGGGDLGLQLVRRSGAAAGMVLLGLLQSGGWVLGQAMEQVTGGNLLSTLLIACAFILSLVYLFRLAVSYTVQLPAGAVRASRGSSVCARAKRVGSGALAVEGALGTRVVATVLQAIPIFAVGGGHAGPIAGIRIRSGLCWPSRFLRWQWL